MKSLKTIIHTQTKNGKTYKYAQTGYKFTRIDDKSLSASEKLQIEMMSAFAKHYSQCLSQNIKRGIRAKKERELADKVINNQNFASIEK